MKKLTSAIPEFSTGDNFTANSPEARPGNPSRLNAWVEELITDLVLSAPENRLEDFGGSPIFGRPLLAIADGHDDLFTAFRDAVSPRHLTPAEILERYFPERRDPKNIRVIAWALPFTQEIRLSNREGPWPSALYSVARNNGGALNYNLCRRLTALFQKRDICAVSPLLLHEYDAFRDRRHTFSSTWSERHVAYAAGLGRFGLNGSLITAAGGHVRLGSIVVDYPFEPASRLREAYASHCLKTGGEDCGACLSRCPVQAISERGLDKQKCYERRQDIRKNFLRAYSETYRMLPSPIAKSGSKVPGLSLGCALCQCGVPCEGADPYLERTE
jgi:epoxyqueuosine reductase